jgi:type I restriction enzyme, S subunit
MNCVFSYSTARDSPNIPSGWVRVAVSRLVEKHFCGPSPDCEERQVASAEEWGVLKTTAITWDGWNETAHKVLPRAYWGRHGLEVKTGDVLVTKAGPRDRVGVVVYVNSDPKHLIVSGKMIGLRLHHDQVLPQVLAGALSLRKAQDYIHARTTGMAESQVNFANDVLLNTEVCIPPLPDQSRIAAVLDTMDEAIAKTEAVIAKLKQVRAGLLHDLLTRGLDEHGQLRDPIAHPDEFQDSPLGRIPRDWDVLSLETLLARVPTALRSGPFGSALLKQELKESGIPLLGIDNVHVERFVAEYQRFVDDEKFMELKQYAVRPLDVMITIMGTVGRCCVVPESIGPALSSKHVWTITFDRQRYSPYLACWQMNYAPWVLKQLRRDEQGGVMTAIRSETLRNLLLPVPCPPEAHRIETLVHESSKQIVCEEKLLHKVLALKSGLMENLLTGQVRVPESLLDRV